MPPWSLCCILYKNINWMPEVAAALVGISAPEAYLKCLPSSECPKHAEDTTTLLLLSNIKLPQRQR